MIRYIINQAINYMRHLQVSGNTQNSEQVPDNTPNSQQDDFNRLPDGPKTLILKKLSARDLQAMRCVNKSFNELGKHPELLGNLELFKLNIRRFSGEKLVDFLRNPESQLYLKKIDTLDLKDKNLKIEHLNEILSILHGLESNNIQKLDLGGNNIGTQGASAIAGSENLSNLTELHLGHNNIGDEGARAIAGATNLRNLTELHLELNNIRAEGARAIAGSTNLRNLTELNLRYNNIGPEGASAIAGSTNLSNLTELHLWGNNVDDAVQAQITASANLSGLQVIF